MTGTIDTLTADETSRFVEVGGVRVHYHDSGTRTDRAASRPPLVLLHGGGPGASGWSNFSQNVGALSQDFRVLVVDQPGYGQSDKPVIKDGVWTFNARILDGLLESLGIQQVHVVGNSLGGGTAMKLALDYPERVGRLVLMGPGGGALNLFSADPSEGLKVLFSFYAPPGPSVERIQNVIDMMMFEPKAAPPDLLQERFEAATAPEAVDYATRLYEAFGPDGDGLPEELWRDADRISQKTLLVWGRDDRVLPLDGAFFLLKRMPNAQLHVFSRCGHWAQLEHRDEFNRLTVDFLTYS